MKQKEVKELKKGLEKAAKAVLKASEALSGQADKLRETESKLAGLSLALERLQAEK